MLRGLFDTILLFCLPFAAYTAYLFVRPRLTRKLAGWSRDAILRLVIAGLALAIAGMVLGGLFGNRQTGAYVPAHLDHGVLVPGRME